MSRVSSVSSRRCRVRVAAACVLLAATAGGCSSCKESKPVETIEAAPSPQEPADAPVPAPDGMLAEVYVATPNAVWARLQKTIGGVIAILPRTFGGLVCELAGLDPAIVADVDGDAPAFGILGERDSGVGYALALKLRDPRHAAALLLDADNARFEAKDVGGLRVLRPRGEALPLASALARGGYLIVASREDELLRLGPYVHRTLPTKPLPANALEIVASRDALAGPLRAMLARAWSERKAEFLELDARDRKQKRDGGAPDFGDPPAIVATLDALVRRRVAMLGDLASARVSLDAGDDDVHATLTLEPASADGPAATALASMHPGDAAPLLAAPGDASLALLLRDGAAERAADARDLADAIARALGPRLTKDDATRLGAALAALARGRGDWLLGAVSSRAPSGVSLRAPVANAEALAKSARDMLELIQRPAFREPLRNHFQLRDLSTTTVDAPLLGKVSVATLTRDPSPKRPGPRAPLGVASAVFASEWSAAAGESAVELLGATARPTATLEADKRVAHALAALGANATFAVVLQLQGPVVFAWGRREGMGWARLEIAPIAVRELIRLAAGL